MQSMNRTPKVSVGLPVFNGERYIALAIESLLAQTYRDFELIICDNASTDRTEDICRNYAAKDRRIRYVRNPTNLGPSANYRRAFELSTAPYFRWATYDDLSESTSLVRCVEVLDRDPSAVLAYPKTRLIDAEGNAISEYQDRLHLADDKASERFIKFFQRVAMCNPVYGLMRRDSLRCTELIGGFIASDKPFLAELALYGKFIEIPEFLFLRRMHDAAYSSSINVTQMLAWYNPSKNRKVALVEWRHYWQYAVSVVRAPMSLSEKHICLKHIIKMAIWGRHALAQEMWLAMRQLLRVKY